MAMYIIPDSLTNLAVGLRMGVRMESRVRMNTLYSNLFISDTVSPRRGHIIDRDSQFKVVLSTNPDEGW